MIPFHLAPLPACHPRRHVSFFIRKYSDYADCRRVCSAAAKPEPLLSDYLDMVRVSFKPASGLNGFTAVNDAVFYVGIISYVDII